MTLKPGTLSPSARNAELARQLLKGVALLGVLYVFVLGITLLSGSFKLMGHGTAAALLHISNHPFIGLFVGILATAIMQSSSTTTTIVVGLVGSGALSIPSAVPVIMGANIGTSVTNTIVSLGHITSGPEFRRAFAGSIVHDFFNIFTVLVVFPLELAFSLISRSATFLVSLFGAFGGGQFNSPVAAITKPISNQIIHSLGDNALLSMLVGLVLLFLGLRYLVKILKSMVLARVERFFHRYIFRQPALGFLLGIALTVLVQSSSITTSIVVPLIGAGVISIEQVYPYFLGANIGTTATAFLASFALGSSAAVTIAVSHLLFNLYGIFVFWPLNRLPISLSKTMAKYTQRSRLIAVVYILLVFFVIPGMVVFFAG